MAGGAISIMVKVEDVGGGFKQLSLDADGLRKIMEANVAVANDLQKKYINFASFATGVNAVAKAFSQLTSGLQSLTSESLAFNDAMRAANTMAGQDAAGFARLKSDVADLAKEIPLTRDVLANGLYEVVSNGVPEDNWISFLQTSARSAVGGIANLGQTVTVTSTLIKNYGLEWEAAQEIQDKIQLSAKNGKTSFEELAQSLPRVAGNAATLGVSVNELMASFATLTGVSGNTAEVSTQLASIFTALVKPSSQAAEMAASMGIQFNAAAIKAAGGFQNFIAQLDSTVQAYAQANGVLAQEVYGRLFGSAESMRALIPITGELAETFSRNIEAMEGSVGTMDAAFEEMDSTFEAKTQRIKNYWAGVTDAIASVTGSFQPMLNAIDELVQGAASVVILVNGLKKLDIASRSAAAATKLLKVSMATVKREVRIFTICIRALNTAAKTGRISLIALKLAARELLIATGIGVAIWALTAAISYLCGAADDAAESIEELSSADEAYTSAASQAQLQIEEDIAGLKRLMDANADTSAAVAELNERYGYLFGTFSDAIQAYDTLTDKSKLYVRQMGYEAKAAELRRKAAEADVKADIAADKMRRLEDAGLSHGSLQVKKNLTPGHLSLGVEEIEAASYEMGPYREAREEWEAARSEAEKYYAELEKIKGLSAENEKAIRAEQAATASQIKISEMSWEQCAKALENNEKAAKATTDPKIHAELAAQNDQLRARQLLMEKRGNFGSGARGRGSNNVEKTRIQEIEAELSNLRNAYLKADDDGKERIRSQAAELKKERGELQKLLDEFDNLGNTDTDVADTTSALAAVAFDTGDFTWVKSIDEMQALIGLLRAARDEATDDTEIADLNKKIELLEEQIELKNKLGKSDKNKTEPKEVNYGASALKDIESNITVLRSRLEEADIAEAAILNREIALWEKKAEAIRNAGKETMSVAEAMRGSWGAFKGIGNGVESINEALKGNGSAWQKLTTVVDSCLQVYEGVNAIIGIVQTLLGLTMLQAGAETVKATTTGVSVATTKMETEAIKENTNAAVVNIGAKAGESIANATESGSKLPFPLNLVAIAAGVAAVVGAMALVGCFANGGIVGGASPSGDKLVARVNSGEMILNKSQQSRLFSALNGRTIAAPSISMPRSAAYIAPESFHIDRLRGMLIPVGEPGGEVVFKIRGDKLEGILRRRQNFINRL